jgi:hypothetical protein
MNPNAGEGAGLRGLSQWVQLYKWSPNKIWISYSIFNLCSEWYIVFVFLAEQTSKCWHRLCILYFSQCRFQKADTQKPDVILYFSQCTSQYDVDIDDDCFWQCGTCNPTSPVSISCISRSAHLRMMLTSRMIISGSAAPATRRLASEYILYFSQCTSQYDVDIDDDYFWQCRPATRGGSFKEIELSRLS